MQLTEFGLKFAAVTVIAMRSSGRILGVIMASLLGALSLSCAKVDHPQVTTKEVTDEARIPQLIASLSKKDEAESAQNELLEIAKKSSYNRDRVVQDLIADVKTNERVSGKNLFLAESLDYWDRATRIFWRLEATEAIDVMIQCIFCGNAMTGSFEETPAFDALQLMGKKAIPKLSASLVQHPRDIVRGYVAICLGSIGGPEAKKALKKALRTETDPYVIREIKAGLWTIANSPPADQ